MKIIKYIDLKNNALNKRDKVLEVMKTVDDSFYLGKRDYSLKRNKDKQKVLERMREEDFYLNHY